jgi:DHA3 family tetracycline resistance protein-like MFS transporter
VKRLPARRVYYGLEFLLSMPAFVITAVYFVRVVQMSPLQLVLIGTVMEATVFVFEIPTGAFADTYGRRLSLVVSFIVQGVAVVLVGAVASFWVIAVAWAIWGFGYTFQSGAYEAWITDEVGVEHVGGVFLRGTRICYAGELLGLIASVGIALWSLRAAVIAGGLVTIACGVGTALLMPETGFVRHAPELRRTGLRAVVGTAVAGARHIRGRSLLLLLVAAAFFAGMSSEAFDRLKEAHLIRDIGLPAVGSFDPVIWFGLFGVCVLLVGLLASTILIRRAEALAERVTTLLFPLTAVLAAAELAFALAGSIALALGAFLVVRLARTLASPLYLTWLNRGIADSSVRATVISMSGQADAIGQTAGGPVLGLVGNIFGIRAALVAGAAVLLPALGLFARAARHDPSVT